MYGQYLEILLYISINYFPIYSKYDQIIVAFAQAESSALKLQYENKYIVKILFLNSKDGLNQFNTVSRIKCIRILHARI